MEKRKPHYSLEHIKELLEHECTRVIPRKCKVNAVAIGYLDEEMIVARVKCLTRKEFDKSMTSYENHKIWQDVYKSADDERSLYIKLQLTVAGDEKVVVIQFKTDTGKE